MHSSSSDLWFLFFCAQGVEGICEGLLFLAFCWKKGGRDGGEALLGIPSHFRPETLMMDLLIVRGIHVFGQAGDV